MDLLTFVSDIDRRHDLAHRLDCSARYLWQIATGWKGRRASPEFAKRIAATTAEMGDDAVPLHLIRPDIWEEPSSASGAGH